jgi:hypothetical protein
MKKTIFVLLPLLFGMLVINAQKKVLKKSNTNGSSKKQYAKKTFTIPILVVDDSGESTSIDLKKGTQLVYEVNANGNKYDFIVTLNDYEYNRGIDFNYKMTNENKTNGHVKISKNGKNESRKYVNFFGGGELLLKDASTVWLTGKNFAEMPNKKTDMQIDNADAETFYRQEKDEVYPEVIIFGKKQKLDGFIINNAADATGNKTFWIHNISANPLILKMDLGWTVELKEIK